MSLNRRRGAAACLLSRRGVAARIVTIASTLGDVTYMIDPQKLDLAPGKHTVTLQSLLVDETAHFTTE